MRVYLCRCWYTLVVLLAVQAVHAQQRSSFTNDMLFARYLHNKELYAEATYILNNIQQDRLLAAQKDSLLYWQGWNAYAMKSLDTAASRLLQVSDSAAWALKSHFFGAYCLAFQGYSQQAYHTFKGLPAKDTVEREMQYLEMAGISLLQRNYKQYDSLRRHFTFSSYVMEGEEKRMDAYYDKLVHYKKKSPFLAGLYSAVLPGAGKIYAGKKGQGVGSFLPIAALAALTWESYNRGGVKSARFITFGSLFSLFYVGNIWGSVVAVKVKQSEQNKLYDNKILFDMHIPLRNLYN
ncbi:hypothetical protein SAMN05421788_1049 [Filimonas lacunae]|uniref:TM2 domain-containing protein n=1 Tax=Filimonas lacunae TaxID=477680 RepID=A0A173M9S4_9BACT|nr:hypothetical protein [Filimonas lacunae]BAV04261.1 hypothetical protein FLA_0242 [Filimonas lacunae]SIT13404.1 hypothetical protein SAMN05421788_1049 [Filimonas lacunae]